ncbi:MAG: GPP34 family phosphoprotein, partial [Solirubrobacteraceae bacterium]|nr:GPP34 family phosphoprotein [Solirubrobacteraceae bacterium]
MGTLLIAEELFLLTHDDESGKGSGTMGLDNGYAGALLLDLAAAGLIDADDELVRPATYAGGTPPHPLLEDALAELRASKEPRKAKHWVNKLPGALKPIGTRVGASLVERGVLSEERSKVLGLFPTTKWPEVDP